MELTIEKIVVGEWFENVYLIYDETHIVIVDPGDEPKRLIERIDELGRTPVAILITHGHFDHIGAVCPLVDEYRVPCYIHSKDKRLLRQANIYRKMAGSKTFIEIPRCDRFLDDERELQFEGISIGTIHIPGHTSGSVCFNVDGHLISGDLMFKDEVGRTDLPESDLGALEDSIDHLIKSFPDATIYPGHGDLFKIRDVKNRLSV